MRRKLESVRYVKTPSGRETLRLGSQAPERFGAKPKPSPQAF
jgi:hypothetical protein